MEDRPLAFDAIILAGGRSSRLNPETDEHSIKVDKATLKIADVTLLESTLNAVANATQIVVVGPYDLQVPREVRLTREDPPLGGPAAGILAGLRTLERADRAEVTVILACDMPNIAPAVPRLLEALQSSPDSDGVVAIDSSGRRQHLVVAARSDKLARQANGLGGADGLSARQFFSGLNLEELALTQEESRDIDTWQDARELGVKDFR